MNCLILANKRRSETMAACMERIRTEAGIPTETKVTYAGRLDPMASGLVIFLVGDFRFDKEVYSKLPKVYETEFFLGYSTDTYDILGTAHKGRVSEMSNIFEQIKQFQPIGTFEQLFPPYSSRKVEGKSLFQYAREGNDSIPEVSHLVTLHNIEQYLSHEIASEKLLENITTDISKVSGDFRQEESIASWRNNLPPREMVQMHKVTIEVSSGFYVRQWVHDFGIFLSTDIVTFLINRVTIGMFNMSMLNGESFRIFYEGDPILNNLTN
jgi:tRNA pseudouridine(55) synthase